MVVVIAVAENKMDDNEYLNNITEDNEYLNNITNSDKKEYKKDGFLYIPVTRLIILGILTAGFYSVYWVYKNWTYIKVRDSSDISPFWRTFFGYFFLWSLFNNIKHDHNYNNGKKPFISPTLLLISCILLEALSQGIFSIPAIDLSQFLIICLFGSLVGDYLCLIPVQLYINKAQKRINPQQEYKSLISVGHVICYIQIIFSYLIVIIFS